MKEDQLIQKLENSIKRKKDQVKGYLTPPTDPSLSNAFSMVGVRIRADMLEEFIGELDSVVKSIKALD